METVTAMFLSTQGFTAALEDVVGLDVDDFEGWLVELWLRARRGALAAVARRRRRTRTCDSWTARTSGLDDRLGELEIGVDVLGEAVPPPPPVIAPHDPEDDEQQGEDQGESDQRDEPSTPPGGSGPVGRNSVLTPAG